MNNRMNNRFTPPPLGPWALLSALMCAIAIAIAVFAPAAIAKPLTCRTQGGHRQCLIDVQRSAKHHRQYRALITLDGQEQERTLYDCQRRIRIGRDRVPQPFQTDGPGPWICALLDR